MNNSDDRSQNRYLRWHVYRGPSFLYKVVHKPKQGFAVWHAEATSLNDWWDTGHRGSVDECWDYIEAKEGPRGYLFKFSDPGG